MTQLSLDLDPARENPNAWMLNGDGTPKRLLWCSDAVRIACGRGEVPACHYSGERARFRPDGPCCMEVPGAVEFQVGVAARVAANRAEMARA